VYISGKQKNKYFNQRHTEGDAMQRREVLQLLLSVSAFATSAIALVDTTPIRIGVIGPVTGKSSKDMRQSIIGDARVLAADIN
jgi:branched-chain amino acid transport system substrate-binding protein